MHENHLYRSEEKIVSTVFVVKKVDANFYEFKVFREIKYRSKRIC